MKVLEIYLAEHGCSATWANRQAKIVPNAPSTGCVEVRCGWPECNTLLATVNVAYPDEPEEARPGGEKGTHND